MSKPTSSPRWRRLRRLFLGVSVILLVLLCTGALYQWLSVRGETGRYPAPGRFVDVDGRRLHIVCIGNRQAGDPAVIVESSGFGSSVSNRTAREEIAAHARVCSYDRTGTGWSDPAPPVMTTGILVADLERLLAGAAIPPPYVIVASSIGGLPAELYSRRHPDLVAGLVMLDAGNSDMSNRVVNQVTRTEIALVCSAKWAARFGLLRLIDPFHLRGQSPAAEASRSIAQLYTVERMASLCAMVRGMRASVAELNSAPALRSDLPLTVLTAGSSEGLLPPGLSWLRSKADAFRGDWLQTQQQFAARSTQGTWRLVQDSAHLIASSQPHVAAEAVLDILARGRAPKTSHEE
jgi:pimeloyl-ACP methyl ester carboxylesterase